MAWAEVGSGSQRNTGRVASGDLVIAYPANVVSGNFLTVLGVCEEGETPSVSDTRTSSWTVVVGPEFPGGATSDTRPFLAYALAASSGANSVTIVAGGGFGGYKSAAVDEFSGPDATPADVDGGSTTGTSTTPSDGITTGVANALILAVMVPSWHSDEGGITPNGAWTEIGTEEDQANWATYSGMFQIVGAAGAYTASWTLGASVPWSAMTHSFEAASGAAPVAPPSQLRSVQRGRAVRGVFDNL